MDLSILRTITANHFISPELDLTSNARITTEVEAGISGTANIMHESLFTGGRDESGYYSGSGSLFYSASGDFFLGLL